MGTRWGKRALLCAVLALPAFALSMSAATRASAAAQSENEATIVAPAAGVTAYAVDSCTRALASDLQLHVVASRYQPRYQDPLQILAPLRQLSLTARNAQSGRVVATVVCRYNRFGRVVSLARRAGLP